MTLGKKLNLSQEIAVKNSLQKIKLNENLATIAFWGAITGAENDYLIAMATSTSSVIAKSFYCSVDDGLSFSKMPETDSFVDENASAIQSMFKGNLAQVYSTSDSERKLTELERLAWVAKAIENDTAMVPRGAYSRTPTGEIVPCSGFAGLSPADAAKLDNYLMFRNPALPSTLARARKAGVSNNTDFLDVVGEGKPGAFSLQQDESGSRTSVRSLEWLGHSFSLNAGDSAGTPVYFGDGIKNVDLGFMV